MVSTRVAKVAALSLLLAGLLVTFFRARGSVPFYPVDLMSYVAAYQSHRDGGNPYDLLEAQASLERRGISLTPFDFVYSPPFLMAMLPHEVVPYRWFRLGWLGAGALSAWAAAYLLSLKLTSGGKVFAVGTFLFLTVSECLQDNLVWGQITAFMLLAVSIMVYRDFKGAVAGIAGSLFPLTKVGFMPLTLFLRGRRALASLGMVLSALLIFAVFLLGPRTFGEWGGRVLRIGESWSFRGSNNLSICHAVCLLSETRLHEMDTERAGRDFDYRHEMADKMRGTSRRIYFVMLSGIALWLTTAVLRQRKASKPPSREAMLSIAVLFLLVFLPVVWIHYGLFLLIPFQVLCRRRRILLPGLFTATVILWGLPIGMVPVWPRFLIPLGWLFWFAFYREGRTLPDTAPA